MRPAGVVVDTWHHLAAHADIGACSCGPAVAVLRTVPDAPAALFDGLCPDGRELFAAWFDAKHELPVEPGPSDRGLAGLRERRRILGMDGLGESRAQLRGAVLVALPPEAFAELLKLPDAERAARIAALERGMHWISPPGETRRTAPEEPVDEARLCRGCGVRFVPEHSRQHHCGPACRQRARRRAALEPTE